MTLYVEQTRMIKRFVPYSSAQASSLLMTGEEMASRADLEQGELIEGVYVEMMAPSYEHGRIESNIVFLLGMHVRQHKLGHIFSGDAGIYTKQNPDTVRGMDVAFMSHERYGQISSKTYLDVAPELIVEVMSPSNRWADMHDKLDEYFAIGVNLVWLVYPKRMHVYVYRAPDDYVRLSAVDTLTGGAILPDFSVPVTELFE